MKSTKHVLAELRRRTRPHLPFIALTLGVLVLYAALFLHSRPGPGNADGHYTYLYARSLAFDRDIEFQNDYALCGDPWATGRDRGTGHPDNPFYAGPALFWAPLVWFAKSVVTFPENTPPSVVGGCSGPIASLALASAVVLGALAIGLSYLAALRFANRTISAVAALLFGVASQLPVYVAMFPSHSHVYQCFACALLLWLTLRATESERLRAWLPVGLATFVATSQRLPDACLVLIPLALLVVSRRSRRFRIQAALVVLSGVLLASLVTLGIYRYSYGSPFVMPQGRNYLHLAHAHPLLALFAPHGGLFYTTPVAYLGVAGLFLAARARSTRVFALSAGLAFALSLWISSAALDWHGKGTFGARRLVVLIPVLVVFSAVALRRLGPFVRRHASALAAIALMVVFGAPVVGSVFAIERGELPVERSSRQAVQYGHGVRAVWGFFDERVGDLAILPAEVVYSLRYWLPPRTFHAATTDKFYRRSYHTLAWEPNVVDFADATLLGASRGFVPEVGGVRLAKDRASAVFAAGWPFATDAELSLDVREAASIELGMGSFARRCWLGERRLSAGDEQTLHFGIPAGCFDSGLMEIVVRSDKPGALSLKKLTLKDSNVYPPSY